MNLLKRLFPFLIVCLVFLGFTSQSIAQTSDNSSYTRGTVQKILKESTANSFVTQEVEVKINRSDHVVKASYSFSEKLKELKRLEPGSGVILSKATDDSKYSILDKYRLNSLIPLLIIFILLVLVTARRKGLGSLIGLIITFIVLTAFVVPMILKGHDPLFISIVGALIMMIITIYLSHGFSQQTTVAVVATFLALVITGLLAIFFAGRMNLSGSGDESAALLQFGEYVINLKGLLLGGIIIGALGVLDDTTTTQSATIYALAKSNPKMDSRELISKGLEIGTEHIASLVNTLVLAYAGVSMPLFIFFVLNPLGQPWWVILNNEMILEEVLRTLTGSIGLILAIPITTVLAAVFSRYKININ